MKTDAAESPSPVSIVLVDDDCVFVAEMTEMMARCFADCSFSGFKVGVRSEGIQLTTHFHLVARLKIRWRYTTMLQCVQIHLYPFYLSQPI